MSLSERKSGSKSNIFDFRAHNPKLSESRIDIEHIGATLQEGNFDKMWIVGVGA